MQSVRGNLSPNQRRLVDDVCQTLGVELKRGRLVLWRDDASELGEALHSVGQAVVRVSDVWFTPPPARCRNGQGRGGRMAGRGRSTL